MPPDNVDLAAIQAREDQRAVTRRAAQTAIQQVIMSTYVRLAEQAYSEKWDGDSKLLEQYCDFAVQAGLTFGQRVMGVGCRLAGAPAERK